MPETRAELEARVSTLQNEIRTLTEQIEAIPTGPTQLTRDQLSGMSTDEILAAHKAGQLRDLLKGNH